MMGTKDNQTILRVENLKKYFPIKGGFFKGIQGYVKAVDDVSFEVKKGETVGLVGESGCGKTTLARTIIKLLDSTEGKVQFRFNNQLTDLINLSEKEMNQVRLKLQYIFQDPFSSLNSRMTVRDIITEPLRINRIGDRNSQIEKARGLLIKVGLTPDMFNRYPHEFSGGQRQRIVIARSLVLDPDLVICDEPVSALDVSVQAQVLNLLTDLQQDLDLTFLFIAHDLSVVNYISDRVIVMYLGKIVEAGTADQIYNNPRHPYTEALLAAIPVPKSRKSSKRVLLSGNVPSPADPPKGCNFHPRCPYAVDICKREEPKIIEMGEGTEHFTACHRVSELELVGFDKI